MMILSLDEELRVSEPAAKNARGEMSATAGRDDQPIEFVKYYDYLQHAMQSAPKRRKGDRTRDLLKLGAIRVLDESGYHAMRVSDICAAAGVAAATFYIYFENKAEITRVVLTEYLEVGIELMTVRPAERTQFSMILASNLKWLEVMQANAGLMRCILQLGDEVTEFRDLAHDANRKWYERITRSLLRERKDVSVPFDVALFASYALGSMMDELARKLVIHPDPALVELTREIAPTHQELAELLTVIWHHTLYGPVSMREELGHAAGRLAALVRN